MTEMSVTYPSKRGGGGGGNRSLAMGRSIKKLAPIEDAPTLSPEEFNQSKRELAMSLRKANALNTDAAPWVFWDVEGALKTTVIDSSDVIQQLSIAEGGVNYSARRYNDLKVLANKLTRELKSKLDDLDEQKKSFERIEALRKSQTEEGVRITQLQHDIHTVEDEIARKLHYTRQLVHIQERLKRNQIKLEAHMVGMTDTVKSLEKEGMEVRVLRNSLDASLSKAITVAEATQSRLAIARKEREVLLDQRKNEVKNAISLQEWIKHREDAKIALALELRGDLTKEEESFLRDQISEKVEKTKHLQKATEESQRRLQAMEDAFTKLKQVTAVSSLEEMHEKFSNQRNNKKALEHDVKDAEARLLAVKAAYTRQEEIFQDLKSSGGGIKEFSREAINRLESSVEQARNTYRSERAVLDRLATVLLGLNQGSRGLLQRVQPFLDLADGGVFELTQTDEDLPWADTLDALSSAEQVLAKMLDAINGEASALGSMQDEEEEENSLAKIEDSTYENLEDVPALANNIRVKSTKINREVELYGRDDDISPFDEISTHNNINNINNSNSNISNAINNAMNINNINIGSSSNSNNMMMNSNNRINGANASLSAFGLPSTKDILPNTSFSSGLDYDELNDDNNLSVGGNSNFIESIGSDGFPSRLAVKKISLLTTLEAQKKSESDTRRKRLLYRMNGKNGAIGSEDGGAGIASIAKLKAQRAMAERLSTTRSVTALPQGVAISDDIITKTNAFLHQMPELL